MSISPPIRRLSVSSLTKQEELINAYEAEEERIMNVLSKKLEQLREEKIELENVLEAESESHVNRLTRELTSLRLAQQQLAGLGASPGPSDPSVEIMLSALQRENEALRSRLVDTERDYVRISRLNEVYREELLEHRNRVSGSISRIAHAWSDRLAARFARRAPDWSGVVRSVLPGDPPAPTVYLLVQHLVPDQLGAAFPHHPPHQWRPYTPPGRTDPSCQQQQYFRGEYSPLALALVVLRLSVPLLARHVAQPHEHELRQRQQQPNEPPTSYNPGGVTFGAPSRGLTYPSVPPPSLSSSFGSPTVSYHMPHREPSLSPVEPQSRRNSMRRGGARVVESGSLRSISRGTSMERGARVAETGQLIPRSHPDGHTLPATTEAPDSPRMNGGIDIPPNGNSHTE
ncbi:hypothetical protein B0H17DRAFT_1050064 [Mycena rosella]|uniref:Uncharacterized protein n=1 Tax=Mycena rosella TaxID=1033263 RepID=A0AAD7DUU9_MYCRO|nr:hypothetical protein B0H17DRAFT_1050064 [Mycena rosella]